jgi:hypothetical protein
MDEALSYGFVRQPRVNGFSHYDGGMYLAVTEEYLPNYLFWQNMLHLGTYESILWLTHEGFHMEQCSPKWQYNEDTVNRNRERNDFLENTPARAKRDLLQRQLLKAVSAPGNTQLILEALATYADWKQQFPDDYAKSLQFDRTEGTAHYYELVTGLYAGYPSQIKNSDDVDAALALLATREEAHIRHGLTAEGYTVGGFASVLLDRLETDWKERLMADPYATPIEMLYQHFKGESLPAPRQVTQADIDAVAEAIKKPDVNKGAPLLFKTFYDMVF